MFKFQDLRDEKLHSLSSRAVLYLIIDKALSDRKNTVKMQQTHIAKYSGITRQTVANELKYLQDEGYITFCRSLYWDEKENKNYITTAITLQEKALAIINNYTTNCKKNAEKKEASVIVSAKATETTPNEAKAIAIAEEEETPLNETKVIAKAEELETPIEELRQLYDSLTDYQKELCYKIQIADDKEEPYVEAVLKDVPIELANEFERNKIVIAYEE